MLEKINALMEQYKTNKKEILKVHQSDWLKIHAEKFILNNGRTLQRDIIIKPHIHAVMVIPKTVDNKFLIVIQPRPGTETGVTIEFPAGYAEEDEDMETAAKRELLEETGYVCDSIKQIKTYYQDVACSNSKITLLIAEECRKIANQKLDESEMITYIELTYSELLELFSNDMINDANTLLALYYLNSNENID